MDAADFDFELPPELIAQTPQRPRDHSRLLVLQRSECELRHVRFYQLAQFLQPGDLLVANNTRVLRMRLPCRRSSGGKAELLLLRRVGVEPDQTWEALIRPGRAGRAGAKLIIGDGAATATVVGTTAYGGRTVQFTGLQPEQELLEQFGEVPTPPYIHHPVRDADDYQTVYAVHAGSAAAPTAGFHFTPELLAHLAELGIPQTFVTLHIGLDTFLPIRSKQIADHRMHSEFYEIPAETVAAIAATRARGGRIVAVGTTTVRALESAAGTGPLQAVADWTRLFITPGYSFRVVDGLITNFHLPRSTLLVLVSALVGRERLLATYREAVDRRYRFYSFGDAMLIL